VNISVIIPAYNSEDFILDALESAAKQIKAPKEIIVINDGSTDRTLETIKTWKITNPNHPPTKIISQDNKGVPRARNAGIEASTGEWIALLDSDDIWEDSHLESLERGISLIPESIAAYSAGTLFNSEKKHSITYDKFWDNPSEKLGTPIKDSYFKIEKNITQRLTKGNFIKPSSLMFSKSSAIEIGLFNENLLTSEDREFLVRLISHGTFVYCSKPTSLYRWHDNNLSQEKNSKINTKNMLTSLRIISENKALNLTREDLDNCKDSEDKTIESYLYLCSLDGFTSYIKGISFVLRSTTRTRTLSHIKISHIAHCVVFNVKNKHT